MKKSLLLILTVLFFSLTACDLLNETVDENDLSAISLNGDKTIDIEVNTEYTDLGVEAVGILGEILTYEVEGSVDTSLLGEYVLTYKAYYSDEDCLDLCEMPSSDYVLCPVQDKSYVWLNKEETGCEEAQTGTVTSNLKSSVNLISSLPDAFASLPIAILRFPLLHFDA